MKHIQALNELYRGYTLITTPNEGLIQILDKDNQLICLSIGLGKEIASFDSKAKAKEWLDTWYN